jgi:trehalose 6-phosphate phosphatase
VITLGEPLVSLDPILPLLRQHPLAILSDVDGTISRLAPTPALACVTPRNLELLEQLSRLALVGVVSGRDLGDLQRLVSLPDIVYVGLHGLAWRITGADELAPEAREYRSLTLDAAAELSSLKRIAGLVFEVKTVGIALHYRKAKPSTAARYEILRAIASSPAAARFEVHEAIRVVELRPPIGITKGVAISRLADRFSLRGILYLGDDLTDVDAFDEIRRLRGAPGVLAWSIAAMHPESPPVVVERADFTVSGVEGVEGLLEGIVETLVSAPRQKRPTAGRADC